MSEFNSSTTVLVTGASGFVAAQCICQLLEQGYRVRATVRRSTQIEHFHKLFAGFALQEDQLSFAEADLLRDAGWNEAVTGCQFVLHIASPVPAGHPKDENELIKPAREGTLRVLRAAKHSDVRRIVVTSSLGAVVSGHADYGRTLTEDDWSDLEGNITAYAKSKTLAEQAAWDFATENDLEVVVINPGVILGPLLPGFGIATSVDIVRKMMSGKYPGSPRYKMAVVDVRDVAAAHIAAMINPQAAGRRYCCLSEILWVEEVAQTLVQCGYQVRTRRLPNWLVRLVALYDPQAAYVVSRLDRDFKVSNERLVRELNWHPRTASQAICATGDSMIALGIV